jgi:general secretion pathway protein I
MRRAATGFSLLEVLVAFVILALTLSVMMRIFSGGLGNAALSEDYTRALLLAESRLAELGAQPVEGEAQGEFDGKYRWHSLVRPWADEPDESGMEAPPLPVKLMEIEVRVAWGEESGGRQREIGLSALRLIPVAAP